MGQMSGKTCVVTGATSGIGREIALALARLDAKVGIVCRDRERGEAVRDEIARKTGGRADVFVADLASQAEIRRVARELLEAYPRIDVLVNNAGGIAGRLSLTEDGIERTFAVNHLAYVLLTYLLLDRLRASAPSRIVNVSSAAHRMGQIDFDNLRGEKRYSSQVMYGRSKLANILFTRELSLRLHGSSVVVNAFHPGIVRTRFGDTGPAWYRWLIQLVRPFMRSPERGADTGVWLAAAHETGKITGKYFFDREEAGMSDAARNELLARQLWDASADMTGIPRDWSSGPGTAKG
jgi:retinol dehydrogenase 14